MSRRSVLVFDGIGEDRSPLLERMRRLDIRGLRVKTPEEALGLLGDRRFAVGAAVIPPGLPVVDLGAALADLRARAPEGRLGVVVAGPRPGAEGRRALEEAGVELALWEPFADAALRFQLNRALGFHPVGERGGPRVPLARRARILTRSAVKTASIYSLSAGGAFLETPRPSPRGAEVRLELVLPDRDVGVSGRVLYTNVPGNLRSRSLPLGMGIAFTRASPEALRSIEECLGAAAWALEVGDPRRRRDRANRGWLRRFVRRP